MKVGERKFPRDSTFCLQNPPTGRFPLETLQCRLSVLLLSPMALGLDDNHPALGNAGIIQGY
jgi:hypothetical protein